METEIVSSRRKTVLLLLLSLGFVAISVFLPCPPDPILFWGGIFFSICALVFVGLLIRPQKLVIDQNGFTLAGGLVWSPKKIEWRDVDKFFVVSVRRGVSMIGFNYADTYVERPRGTAFSQRIAGCDGSIPGVWSGPKTAVVDRLNGYRQQAIQSETA
jgi:hypothetical protein